MDAASGVYCVSVCERAAAAAGVGHDDMTTIAKGINLCVCLCVCAFAHSPMLSHIVYFSLRYLFLCVFIFAMLALAGWLAGWQRSAVKSMRFFLWGSEKKEAEKKN